MPHRQPKLSPALRITAAGCIALWLLAASCCSLGILCSDDHHAKAGATETVAHHESDHAHEAEAAEHAHAEVCHPHDSEQPTHDSHPCEGGSDNSCCSTLKATAQIAKPSIATQPHFESLILPTVLQAREPMLAAPEAKPLRQAKDHNLVLTPVGCLGPAHRSLAPPSLA